MSICARVWQCSRVTQPAARSPPAMTLQGEYWLLRSWLTQEREEQQSLSKRGRHTQKKSMRKKNTMSVQDNLHCLMLCFTSLRSSSLIMTSVLSCCTINITNEYSPCYWLSHIFWHRPQVTNIYSFQSIYKSHKRTFYSQENAENSQNVPFRESKRFSSFWIWWHRTSQKCQDRAVFTSA